MFQPTDMSLQGRRLASSKISERKENLLAFDKHKHDISHIYIIVYVI